MGLYKNILNEENGLNVCISVSGGETSWYMAHLLNEKYKNKHLVARLIFTPLVHYIS